MASNYDSRKRERSFNAEVVPVLISPTSIADAVTAIKTLRNNGVGIIVGKDHYLINSDDDVVWRGVTSVISKVFAYNADFFPDTLTEEDVVPKLYSASEHEAVVQEFFVEVPRPNSLKTASVKANLSRSPDSTRPDGAIVPSHSEPVMPGLIGVVGGSGQGKTEYVWSICQPDLVLRFGERTETWDWEPGAVAIGSFLEYLVAMVVAGALGLTTALDSARILTFELDGTTGSKGVSNAILTVSTNISNLISALGATSYMVFNPQSDDASVRGLYDALTGSIAGMVLIENRGVADSTFVMPSGRVVGLRGNDFDPEIDSPDTLDGQNESVGPLRGTRFGGIDPSESPALARSITLRRSEVRGIDSVDELDESFNRGSNFRTI